MRELRPCLGLLTVERAGWFDFLRWEPAAVWSSPGYNYKVDDWKRQVHLVAKASLSPSLRDALGLLLPEEQTPDRRGGL